MKRRLILLMLALWLLLPFGVPSWGQVTTGTIVGTVQDTSQAVIPDATITVSNTEKGTSLVYKTDQSGI